MSPQGSGVKGAPRIHICNFTQLRSRPASKWAASRALMCISKTKAEEKGGQRWTLISQRFMGVMKSALNKPGSTVLAGV